MLLAKDAFAGWQRIRRAVAWPGLVGENVGAAAERCCAALIVSEIRRGEPGIRILAGATGCAGF